MNSVFQEHLSSAVQTFLTTFIVIVGTTLQSGDAIQWNTVFWGSVVMIAARGAIKEVFARLAPTSLGGRKA